MGQVCTSFHNVLSRKLHSRKEDLFQGLRAGSCLTLGKELSEEIYMLTKQKTLLGRGAQVESSRVKDPRRTAPLEACSLKFSGNGVSFWVVCLVRTWSGSGSFLVSCASLSQLHVILILPPPCHSLLLILLSDCTHYIT